MSESSLVVVVGGANGIGAATCRVMAERGWRVAIVDRDLAAAEQLATSLSARAYGLDVTDHAAIDALVQQVHAQQGGARALVVASGAFQAVLAPQDVDAALWDKIFAVNVHGLYRLNVAFGLQMVAQGGGSIVNVASVTGTVGAPTHAYAPSKSAVITLSRNLACEWGHAGVRVNTVSPGVTLVKRILDRWATGGGTRATSDPASHAALMRCVDPVEVARAIYFLASEEASAITGVDLPIDAGWIAASGWEMYGGARRAPARSEEAV